MARRSSYTLDALLQPGRIIYCHLNGHWIRREIRTVVDESFVVWRWWRGQDYGWCYGCESRFFLELCYDHRQLRASRPRGGRQSIETETICGSLCVGASSVEAQTAPTGCAL